MPSGIITQCITVPTRYFFLESMIASGDAGESCSGHTFASSQVQSGVAVGVLHINVGIGGQQCLHRRVKAAASRIVQGCCAILCLYMHGRALTFPCILSTDITSVGIHKDKLTANPMHICIQRCNSVDGHLYVHISAGLDEGFHNGQVACRCCCMQSSGTAPRSHTRLR